MQTTPDAPASTVWRFMTTPPMSGHENMVMDRDVLDQVDRHEAPPTLRFFRWSEPTLSFGRLQQHASIQNFIPKGWSAVQRPTGGGMVLHDQDVCFSLVWKAGTAPLPLRVNEVYSWIHFVVQQALAPWIPLHSASPAECPPSESSFQQRQCFEAPVAYDLMVGSKKIVGGALAGRRTSWLYQGTINAPLDPIAVEALARAFERRFRY